MLKADLHLHTGMLDPHVNYSPKELIDYMVKLGFKVIAITEHGFENRPRHFLFGSELRFNAPLRTYDHIKDYAKKKGLVLIPGTEAFLDKRETILLNFKKDLRKYLTLDSAYDLKDENVLVMAPHPFFVKMDCLGDKLIEHIKLFDAIEHSHFYTTFVNKNKKAIEVARKYKKALIANSDAHRLYQIDTNYTLIDAEPNIDSVLEAIRKNKVEMVTRPLTLFEFLRISGFIVTSTLREVIYGEKLFNLPLEPRSVKKD